MSHFSLLFWTNNNFYKREFPKTLHRLTDLREKISTLSFKKIKERAQKRTVVALFFSLNLIHALIASLGQANVHENGRSEKKRTTTYKKKREGTLQAVAGL